MRGANEHDAHPIQNRMRSFGIFGVRIRQEGRALDGLESRPILIVGFPHAPDAQYRGSCRASGW